MGTTEFSPGRAAVLGVQQQLLDESDLTDGWPATRQLLCLGSVDLLDLTGRRVRNGEGAGRQGD